MEWLSARTPLVLGHRGASAYAPENTLAAFELAARHGADGIEFDVQLTADGWPVVIHDSRVDRTTNGCGQVPKLSLAELRSLDAGDGQVVPTLDEVFEQLGQRFLLLNVEIKRSGLRSRGIEATVADRIRVYHLEDRTIVSSFSPRSLWLARRHLSSQTPVALIRAPGWLKYCYWLFDGEADHPHHSMVNEKYMVWARKRGYRVHVWTVDDPVEAVRLADLGVHAIISNKPDVILAALESALGA